MKRITFFMIPVFLVLLNCSRAEKISAMEETNPNQKPETLIDDNITSENEINILTLGDSYTIGQSVCESCRFPEQLKDSLKLQFDIGISLGLNVIARTGWTTSDLINAIQPQDISNKYDVATLLIGVNNEFQNKPFSLFEKEFPELVNIAISKCKGIKSNVIVVSIPDYAFTPFGNGDTNISNRIDSYNRFAQIYCTNNDISYVYITDITREGLNNPALVADDGLHPSELAYTKFVERLLPLAFNKLSN